MAGKEEFFKAAQLLNQLPETHRQVIKLRYFDQLSLADVAKAMDRTPNAIAGLIHRALKRLRDAQQES